MTTVDNTVPGRNTNAASAIGKQDTIRNEIPRNTKPRKKKSAKPCLGRGKTANMEKEYVHTPYRETAYYFVPKYTEH